MRRERLYSQAEFQAIIHFRTRTAFVAHRGEPFVTTEGWNLGDATSLSVGSIAFVSAYSVAGLDLTHFTY